MADEIKEEAAVHESSDDAGEVERLTKERDELAAKLSEIEAKKLHLEEHHANLAGRLDGIPQLEAELAEAKASAVASAGLVAQIATLIVTTPALMAAVKEQAQRLRSAAEEEASKTAQAVEAIK